MKKLLFAIFAFSALLSSCSKDDDSSNFAQEIIGTWRSQPIPVEVVVEGTSSANVEMIKSGLSDELNLDICFKSDGTCEVYDVNDNKAIILKGNYTVSSGRVTFSAEYEENTETSHFWISTSMNVKLEKEGINLLFIQDKESLKYLLERNIEEMEGTVIEKENARKENEALLKSITNCRVSVRMIKQK